MSLLRTDFDFVRELVRKKTGIVLDERQSYLADSRLGPVARQLGIDDMAELVRRARLIPEGNEARSLVEAMTTNETSFFRDVHPFETLRTQIIPELMDKRRNEKRINVWCAACSTGQEPYSIAMMLHDHFGGLPDWRFQITATDISTPVLERAREGLFNQLEAGRGLPASLLVKHFEREGTQWRIKSRFRTSIDWRHLNLVEPWPSFPMFDVIFIRNVLIYFSPETRKSIVDRLARQLRRDGSVFLGSSESLIGVTDSLAGVQVGRSTVFRQQPSER